MRYSCISKISQVIGIRFSPVSKAVLKAFQEFCSTAVLQNDMIPLCLCIFKSLKVRYSEVFFFCLFQMFHIIVSGRSNVCGLALIAVLASGQRLADQHGRPPANIAH